MIVTKCPADLKPMEYRVITKAMNLFPYQQLYFTTLTYGDLQPIFCGENRPLNSITPNDHVLLLTGIASPKQMMLDLSPYTPQITPLTYGDHHDFTPSDLAHINEIFNKMPSPKLIITTEKDATRLMGKDGLSEEVRHHLFTLPVHIHFMLDQAEKFNDFILGYMVKNSRNSILVKAKSNNAQKGRQEKTPAAFSSTIRF